MEIKRKDSQPSAQGPAEWFTGNVRIDPLHQAPAPARVGISNVTFEPGARTAWHSHPLGQTLIVVSGMGAQGCALGTRAGIRYFGPVSMDTPVIDTNGAGDGLAVGFLSSYVLDGYSLEDSIRRGQIAARYTCAQKASSAQLIRQDIMQHYFEK